MCVLLHKHRSCRRAAPHGPCNLEHTELLHARCEIGTAEHLNPAHPACSTPTHICPSWRACLRLLPPKLYMCQHTHLQCRHAGNMWGDAHVGVPPQRGRGWQWLSSKHIQQCKTNLQQHPNTQTATDQRLTRPRRQPSMLVVLATVTGSSLPCCCSTSRCSHCAPMQEPPPHRHAGFPRLACPTQPAPPFFPLWVQCSVVPVAGKAGEHPRNHAGQSTVCVCTAPCLIAGSPAHLLTVQCSQEVCLNHMLAAPTIDEGTPRPHPRQQLSIDDACRGVVAAAAAHSRHSHGSSNIQWDTAMAATHSRHSHGSSSMVADKAVSAYEM